MTAQQTSTIEDLRVTLIAMLGRMVSMDELREAMDLKTTTFYAQVREGRAITLNNLYTVARSFGLNEVTLWVEAGLIDAKAAEEYVEYANEHDVPSLRRAKRSRTGVPDL